MNNSFIQNEHQRRKYLMEERQNEIVLWVGFDFDYVAIHLTNLQFSTQKLPTTTRHVANS